jgi:hypothetical protein
VANATLLLSLICTMAGPFHLLILIMLVMVCTTTGQPTGPSSSGTDAEGSSRVRIPTKIPDQDSWEAARTTFLVPENARYGHHHLGTSLNPLTEDPHDMLPP